MQRHPTTFSSSTRRALSTTTSEDIVQLSYSEFQPSNKGTTTSQQHHPPVILLHGLLGNKRNFASLASSLSTQLQNPRSIYTVDLRNHGENTHDWKNTMSYSEMARDVLAFMDKISSEEAVIVGHSMGGKVAQSLALMAPERVAGLVVLDISPVRYYSDNTKTSGGVGDDSGWKVVEQIVRSVAQIDLEEGGYKTKREVDAVLRDGILEDPALRAFVLTNLEQLRAKDVVSDAESQSLLKWKIHWDGIVNELDRIAGFDVHDQSMDSNLEGLEEQQQQSSQYTYDGDVFFIHGGASRFVRSSHLPTITSYFPNHMLTTIRGVGHWVHAEAPDDTIALLKRYLDR